MKLKLYVIHDAAVKEYIGVETARTHGEAERKFKLNVNNKDNGFLHQNPENFGLYYVGDYETETGLINPQKEPQFIISAIQCKENLTGGLQAVNH